MSKRGRKRRLTIHHDHRPRPATMTGAPSHEQSHARQREAQAQVFLDAALVLLHVFHHRRPASSRDQQQQQHQMPEGHDARFITADGPGSLSDPPPTPYLTTEPRSSQLLGCNAFCLGSSCRRPFAANARARDLAPGPSRPTSCSIQCCTFAASTHGSCCSCAQARNPSSVPSRFVDRAQASRTMLGSRHHGLE